MIEIPGYKIEDELGRGGMATVYRALQESVERLVALKVMSPMLLVDTQFSDRFIREAKIAANLYHPHIVAVHDVGVHEGQPYIAMEFLQSGDLASRIESGKLDLPAMLRIVREIAGALHYAHRKGFVHRDVKPENILFREDGSAVLTDFGIARAVNSATQMTRTGAVIGTPQYMSPEQARGRELDGRSDIYGLGIVLYEMLIGKAPFEGSDSISVGIKHVTEPAPRLPGRHSRLQPLLDRFLAKQPEERFQTGEDALNTLKALEAQIVTGPMTAVQVTPTSTANAKRETTSSRTSSLDETTVAPSPLPESRNRKVAVSATPRPDGSLRQEPTLGSLEDFSSFERTVSQPGFDLALDGAKPAKRRLLPVLALMILVAAAAAAWWQRESLIALLPDREVGRLLERANAAVEYKHWYGDTQQYANRLYERVLQLDPDNERARAGMELVAQHMLDEAQQAISDGNPSQGELYIDRARELAPNLSRIDALESQIANDSTASASAPEIDQWLARARSQANAGKLVRPLNDNAVDTYRRILAEQPDNREASAGMVEVTGALLERFQRAMDSGNVSGAERALADLAPLIGAAELAEFQTTVDQARRLRDEAAAAQDRELEEARRADAAAQSALDDARLRLEAGDLDSAVAAYRRALQARPGNSLAKAGLEETARRYLLRAEDDLEADRLEEAEQRINTAQTLSPSLSGLDRARSRLALYRQQSSRELSPAQQEQLDTLLTQAATALRNGDLMAPPGGSAYDLLKAALRLDPQSSAVARGLSELASTLMSQATNALDEGNTTAAFRLFTDAQQTDPRAIGLADLRIRLARELRSEAVAAVDNGELDRAESALRRASDLEPANEQLLQLQLRLSIARDSDPTP